MMTLARKASRVADSTLPVLIQGPTGSGKECFARALHAASSRATHPFVAVNCAALPETLIESELFGYGPGAFTGARKEGRRGKIAQSSGGTLFLDEIGDMPPHLQTRLLRVLEEDEIIPLGSETTVPVDLRVVCASNRDLRQLIAAGEFREDLYYRLNGILLDLPPLAERADKDVLIRRLLVEESGKPYSIDAAALDLLESHTWPGNIRELRNVIRSAFAICDDHPHPPGGSAGESVAGKPAHRARNPAQPDQRRAQQPTNRRHPTRQLAGTGRAHYPVERHPRQSRQSLPHGTATRHQSQLPLSEVETSRHRCQPGPGQRAVLRVTGFPFERIFVFFFFFFFCSRPAIRGRPRSLSPVSRWSRSP